jgi:hypothetical protein
LARSLVRFAFLLLARAPLAIVQDLSGNI